MSEKPVRKDLCTFIKVNDDGDTVVFYREAGRGGFERIFLAGGNSTVYHLHRDRIDKELEWVKMKRSSIASDIGIAPKSAFYCHECVLRIVVPEDGMNEEELVKFFAQGNPEKISSVTS